MDDRTSPHTVSKACTLPFFQFDVRWISKVECRLILVTDLEITEDHPGYLTSICVEPFFGASFGCRHWSIKNFLAELLANHWQLWKPESHRSTPLQLSGKLESWRDFTFEVRLPRFDTKTWKRLLEFNFSNSVFLGTAVDVVNEGMGKRFLGHVVEQSELLS